MKITKPWIITIAVTALLVGGVSAYAVNKNSDSPKPQTAGEENINYGAPSKDEKKSGDQQKEKIVEDQNQKNQQNNNEESPKKAASVIITGAGQYGDTIEVRSFITNHYEDGTCTIDVQKGSSKVSKSTPAYRDASTTICTNPLFKRSEFPSAGDWQVTVKYDSPGASGISNPKTIKIN